MNRLFTVALLLTLVTLSKTSENNTVTDLLISDTNTTITEPTSTFNRVNRKMLSENGEEERKALEKNTIEEVRRELNRAVAGLNNTVAENGAKVTNAIADITGGLDVCTALDCNNRGTCIGTKRAYICACVLGYSGKNCEDTMCESVRDCNGRGICFGTTNSLTCLCNIGYAGHRCERTV